MTLLSFLNFFHREEPKPKTPYFVNANPPLTTQILKFPQMSRALNLISTNIQGYGPSESSFLPCLGFSGRAFSISHSSQRTECKQLQVKIMSSSCSLRHLTFVCKASSSGQRRNPDLFPWENKPGYTRNRNRQGDERDSSESLDDSDFLSTKNGTLPSLSVSPKSQTTASPGVREREIVELFRKVQARLRERAAEKEEKKSEAGKGQNKESENVDSLLNLLRKHSVEHGKKKVNEGSPNGFSFDRPRQSGQLNGYKSRSFSSSFNIAREESQETNKPSFSRPVSNFQRKSPVPRVRYEPIVSGEDTFNSLTPLIQDRNTSKTKSQQDQNLEPESNIEADVDMNLVSDSEDEDEEEIETALEPDDVFDDGHVNGELSVAELSDAEEDSFDEEEAEEKKTEVKDLNAMKLTELKALAKARGLKRFSTLKKSELIGLLSDEIV